MATNKLSKDEKTKMVLFMKENRLMWDINDKNYKNFAKKKNLWNQLSLLLDGRSVDDLKKKWKHIRDYEKNCNNFIKAKPTVTGRISEEDEFNSTCLDLIKKIAPNVDDQKKPVHATFFYWMSEEFELLPKQLQIKFQQEVTTMVFKYKIEAGSIDT